MKMFSIIIPTFNRSHLIRRAVESVLNQSYKNWELIIVDDGSSDNTSEIVTPFLKDERIRFIEKENTGAAHSRNVGVEFSSGEWLSFLDSDDTWESNKLEVNVNYLKAYPSRTCFYSSFRLKDFQTDHILKEVHSPVLSNMVEELKNYNPIQALPTVIFPKKVFLEVGGFDINFKARQDVDLYYRISKICDFVFIPEVLVNIYHNLPDRISANNSNRLSGFQLFLKKHRKDMNFGQKSYLAKRIVVFAILNKSFAIAFKNFPLSLWSFGRNFLKRAKSSKK